MLPASARRNAPSSDPSPVRLVRWTKAAARRPVRTRLISVPATALEGALGRHFGVTLAFQNCHRVAVFAADAVGSDAHRKFVSPRAQLLNQSPAFRDC
jgi:hypothetical protein